MAPFKTHSGTVLHLPWDNIDTDQIIPARFLHRARSDGYADQLFHDLRQRPDGTAREDFALNRAEHRGASILLTGKNFGCGSSREHAVWALVDYGFRVLIAPSFGDIFFNNCLKNGLLAIALPDERIARIEPRGSGVASITVNLEQQELACPDGTRICFDIDPHRKKALLHGVSEIRMTLRHAETISIFETRHLQRFPWILPSRADTCPS